MKSMMASWTELRFATDCRVNLKSVRPSPNIAFLTCEPFCMPHLKKVDAIGSKSRAVYAATTKSVTL